MLRPALLAILAFVGWVAAAEEPCTTHDSGKYFDLNPLKSSKDYQFKTTGGHTFTINACRSPIQEPFGLKDVNERDLGGFVRLDHGDFSIGTLNTTLSVQDSRPRLTLSDGSRCKSKNGENQIRASTVIEFVCDTGVFGSGMPRLVAQLPPGDDEDACAFVLEWRTHVACPTNEPGGAWGFFGFLAVITLSIVIMYLVFGTLYNRFVLRLRGVDQIPQFSVASMKYHGHEALDWMKDIAIGMREGGRSMGANSGFFPRSSPSSQSGFGSGREFSRPDTNPVSHQTQNQTHGTGGSSESGSEGVFVRPKMQKASGNSQRSEINPISHQALSRMEHGESLSPPPPVKAKPRPKPLEVETVDSTKDEREYMLGEDEGEEDDDVGVPPPSHRVNPMASTTPAPKDVEGSSAAAVRGRDLGGRDATRL